MRSTFALALLASFFLGSPAAWADWLYTKWGMTAEEVATAAPADLVQLPEGKQPKTPLGLVLAYAPHKAAGLDGFASFAFTDGRLSAVAFSFAGKNSAEVVALMQDQYGPAGETPNPAERREKLWFWRDDAGGNNVRYIHFPASLEPDLIVYTPIRRSDETGL